MEGNPRPDGGRWSDLTTRIASAAVLIAIGAVAVLHGGGWFQALVTFVAAMIVWEVAQVVAPEKPTPAATLAVASAAILSGVPTGLDGGWELLFFLLVPAIGLYVLRPFGVYFAGFALGAQLAAWALIAFRADPGLMFVLWLVLTVVMTDVLGYFAGRHFGGPKFWPAVSPKKTWSGTAAGWAGAAVLGALFMIPLEQGWELIPASVAVALASQAGDIAESALKRRFGVKDSSDLIPGHGGIYDRFDALMGAAMFVTLIWLVTGWPG